MLRLPFEAPGFVQYVSHAGLENAKATDASFMFIYAICMMGVRPVRQPFFFFFFFKPPYPFRTRACTTHIDTAGAASGAWFPRVRHGGPGIWHDGAVVETADGIDTRP